MSRDELKTIADALDVFVADRRVRDQYVEGLEAIDVERFRAYLNTCPRDWLKDVCRRLQLSDSGRAKSDIVDRVLSVDQSSPVPPPEPGRPKPDRKTEEPSPGPAPPPPVRPENDPDLHALEDALWEAADQLRANSKLNATEYFMPVLGLIFLRHATTRFEEVKAEVKKSLPTRGGKTRTIAADDFKGRSAIFIPESARFDHPDVLGGSADPGFMPGAAFRCRSSGTVWRARG